jgi:hypothetical protein
MNFNVQLQIVVKIMPQIMEVCICTTWANKESWVVILYLDVATILEICGDIEHWNFKFWLSSFSLKPQSFDILIFLVNLWRIER